MPHAGTLRSSNLALRVVDAPRPHQEPRHVVFDAYAAVPNDIMLLAPDADPRVLVDSSAVERNGVISPDGRWLAYESNVTGRAEIYVVPFPDVNGSLTPASTEGGPDRSGRGVGPSSSLWRRPAR